MTHLELVTICAGMIVVSALGLIAAVGLWAVRERWGHSAMVTAVYSILTVLCALVIYLTPPRMHAHSTSAHWSSPQ